MRFDAKLIIILINQFSKLKSNYVSKTYFSNIWDLFSSKVVIKTKNIFIKIIFKFSQIFVFIYFQKAANNNDTKQAEGICISKLPIWFY